MNLIEMPSAILALETWKNRLSASELRQKIILQFYEKHP